MPTKNYGKQAFVATARGIRCLADDGHACHSLDEQMIDNWLHRNGLQHEREPAYPSHPQHNVRGRLRADWKVGNTFIEYFGLSGDPKYDTKTDQKIALAASSGLHLVGVFPEDLDRLGPLLGKALSAQD